MTPTFASGRVITFLLAVILLNLTYPITTQQTIFTLLYPILYTLVLGTGIYTVAVRFRRFVIASILAAFTAVLMLIWVLNPSDPLPTLAGLNALVLFQAYLLAVLLEYVFSARSVNRDVLIAAITIYVLIADIFTPFYMSIEIISQQTIGQPAFILAATPEVPVQWQNLIYYSFVTLTTLGYGDVLPVSLWAQAFVSMEAVIGVLYIAILIGRLVGLYTQERISHVV
ncbi:MAG: ion channel [Anaerolineae bacterium]|jgi:hypothetical protein|nr:ion channel [Anaerolineae bacterium]